MTQLDIHSGAMEKRGQRVTTAAADLRLFALVLAAGSATRFGASKQLQALGGTTLVGRAMRLAEAICGSSSILITGSDWRRVAAAAAPLAGFLVRNEHYRQGMASSIGSGVRPVTGIADAVLLLLADQPLIGAAHLEAMRAQWLAAPDHIVASAYAGTCGAPAIFPRQYFAALLALEGDRGASSLLRQHAARVKTLACDDAAIDIDTPADLALLARRTDGAA
ncbi:MAG: hypothetical protein BMS9Abin32_415 [Gammaproteobacteria bacterium]|nr:MAG: hypothetical protein BMS9Abin32_415 [Gammaproteobacteria bacterium]